MATQQPTTTTSPKPLKATCHCGAVTVTAPNLPDEINECQCSICRRYGAAWGYWNTNEVTIEMKEDAQVSQYVWGDKTVSFNFCARCGCMCYWWPLDRKKLDDGTAQVGINTRNMDPMDLLHVSRKIDYAYILAPVDNPDAKHVDDRAKY